MPLGRAALVAPVIARAVFELGQTRPLILEFLARMIELRRMHFQRVRRASCSRGNIEIIDVDEPAENLVRVRPEFRTRPGTECNE